MWAGLTPDSKGDPTGDTGGLIAADRRHHTCLRDAREHCRPLQAARQVPGKKPGAVGLEEEEEEEFIRIQRIL